MSDESCHNCRYSRSRVDSIDHVSVVVECHRRPPSIHGHSAAVWPVVLSNSWTIPWCGEWAPQAPEVPS